MKGKIEKTEIPKNGTHIATCVHGSALSVTYKYFLHWRHSSTHHHHCQSIQNVMEMKHGNVYRTTFSIISAQNALETALFSMKKKRRQRKKKQQKRLYTRPSLPLSKIARLGQREWAAECLLLGWSGVEMIQFTLASTLWHNPSYLILAGAPGLEHGTLLCISLQGRVFAA